MREDEGVEMGAARRQTEQSRHYLPGGIASMTQHRPRREQQEDAALDGKGVEGFL